MNDFEIVKIIQQNSLSNETLKNLALPVEAVYRESFAMMRQFANMAATVRNSTFIQGFVILSGTGYLASNKFYEWAAFTSLFCFFFTITLYYLHLNYVAYYQDIREYVRRLESLQLPFTGYVEFVEDKRDKRVRYSALGWAKTYGSFVLIGAASVVCFTMVLIKMFNLNIVFFVSILDTNQRPNQLLLLAHPEKLLQTKNIN